MLYEYQKLPDSVPLENIAANMSECDGLHIDFTQSLSLLKGIVDEGSRFANLERVLGHGAVFLLCHNGSDALGTKLLPKDGKRFDEAIKVLKGADVHIKAQEYAGLRDRVTSWYHQHVLQGDLTGILTPPERMSPPSSAYLGLEWTVDSLTHDPCLSGSYSPSILDTSGDD